MALRLSKGWTPTNISHKLRVFQPPQTSSDVVGHQIRLNNHLDHGNKRLQALLPIFTCWADTFHYRSTDPKGDEVWTYIYGSMKFVDFLW